MSDKTFKPTDKWRKKLTRGFYEKVEAIREDMKLSNRQFSLSMGKSEEWWRLCVKDTRQIGMTDLKVLSKILDIQIDELLKEE